MDLNLPLQAQIRLCGSFLQKKFSASHPEYLPPFFISSSFVLFVVLLPSFSFPKKGSKREGEITEVFVCQQTRCILQRFLFAGRQDAYWFLFLFAECYVLFSLLKKIQIDEVCMISSIFPFLWVIRRMKNSLQHAQLVVVASREAIEQLKQLVGNYNDAELDFQPFPQGVSYTKFLHRHLPISIFFL